MNHANALTRIPSRSGPGKWIAFCLATAACILAAGAVLAAEKGKGDEQRGREPVRRDAPRHDNDRDRHGYGNGNYYAQPVYVAPEVVAVPVESPGISLFLPLDIRRR